MLACTAWHPTASRGVERSHLPPLDAASVTKSRPAAGDCHETPDSGCLPQPVNIAKSMTYDCHARPTPSYEEIIDRRRSEIEACYRQVLCDVQSINGWHSRRHKMFADATAGELYVDPKVRLVIFNFDAPQLRAANREPNGALHKLREALGRKLVLTKGDPKAFIKGIKSPE